MKNSRVNSITYGALLSALLGVLLFVNRQMAGVLDTFLFWIVPLPVIVYCLKFGVKQSIVMGVSMTLLAFIIATPATTFYVLASILAGIVYGYGVLKKRNAFQLILSVIIISLVVMFVTTFALAGIFGYDLSSDIEYVRELINMMLLSVPGSGSVFEYMTSGRFIMIIIVLSSILTSVMEGILVHLLAFLVLKRLKMELPPMKPLSQIRAPMGIKLFCFTVLIASLFANVTGISQYDDIIIPLLMIVYTFCMFYGYLLVVTFLAVRYPDARKRALFIIPIVLIMMTMPFLTYALGLIDMFTQTRDRIIREITINGK